MTISALRVEIRLAGRIYLIGPRPLRVGSRVSVGGGDLIGFAVQMRSAGQHLRFVMAYAQDE